MIRSVHAYTSIYVYRRHRMHTIHDGVHTYLSMQDTMAWPLECVAMRIERCLVWELVVSNQNIISFRPFVCASQACTITVIT